MELLVVIEPSPDGAGFTARLGDPLNLRANGQTADEAFDAVREEFLSKVQRGMQLRTIPLGPVARPPAPGWLEEDELTQEWRKAVEEIRREGDIEDRRRILGEPPDEKAAS